nr:ribonuclease H-like domain-containing protein [Tanacetum cinerariifolium]
LVHEDFEQIHEDDLEEMDLKWQLALLRMRAKRVECYNRHKMEHFARECRGTRNQDSKNMYQVSSRRSVNVEETPTNAMVAIDRLGFDWSYMAEDEEYLDAPLVKDRVSNNKYCSVESPVVVEKKINVPTIAKVKVVIPKQQEKQLGKLLGKIRLMLLRPQHVRFRDLPNLMGHPQHVQEDQGYVDSGCSRHMIVAFLEKPTESKGFEQIIDFLNANSIKYALTVNPTIYTSCIKQFWATTKVKTVNGEEQIQALVDKKKVIITETSVRSDIHLQDAEGKFDGKADEGFFVGYSMNSKAFRRVEENLHIEFLENKPIVAGTKDSIGAGQSSMETGST